MFIRLNSTNFGGAVLVNVTCIATVSGPSVGCHGVNERDAAHKSTVRLTHGVRDQDGHVRHSLRCTETPEEIAAMLGVLMPVEQARRDDAARVVKVVAFNEAIELMKRLTDRNIGFTHESWPAGPHKFWLPANFETDVLLGLNAEQV